MFDWLFEAVATTLSVLYDLVPNYAVAIALLTVVAMVITTPFTLKGTRSMMQMQMLQPEMRRLQMKYKDDRQKLNEELMAFYRENNLNPLGGCLPLILQAPIFIILFNVVRGLTRVGEDGTFDPKYLDHTAQLFRDLDQVSEMQAFGVDLAESAQAALGIGFVHALPHVLMVAIVAVSAYYQQKQIQGRNPNAEVPPQMKIMMRVFPAMFVVFAFVSPGGLVVYFVTSNLYRIGLQAYITHSLYKGADSLGAKAAAAAKEAKALQEESGESPFPKLGRSKKAPTEEQAPEPAPEPDPPGKESPSTSPKTSPKPANGRVPGGAPPPSARTGGNPNRSKKKKKRR